MDNFFDRSIEDCMVIAAKKKWAALWREAERKNVMTKYHELTERLWEVGCSFGKTEKDKEDQMIRDWLEERVECYSKLPFNDRKSLRIILGLTPEDIAQLPQASMVDIFYKMNEMIQAVNELKRELRAK